MRKLALFFAGAILCSLQLLAQNTTLTGTVVDSRTGTPLSDVTVTATGTNVGTKTDADGKYTITFPATAKTLSFSYVGYQTITRAIGRLATMDVELVESSSDLSEVVVVGYGTQQKKAFTGAASKIDAKEFSQLVTPSVDRQLGGRAAGVQVSTPGGLVNTPARIRVRGVNSITGNRDPLIVVDGVPFIEGNLAGSTNSNALGDINPNDIENIEVLKDGSAAAIFGSRAAGGVIMITTKKGVKDKLRVNYDMSMGVTNVRRAFDLLNADQFITIANEKLSNAGQGPRAVANPGVDTDWQNEVFVKNAFNQQHNISFQGGTRKSTFFLSFGYSDQQGVIISNSNTAYRLRFNFESELNRFIKFGNNTTLAKQIDFDQNNGSNSLGGAVASSLRQLPNVSPYNPNHPSGFNILSPTLNSMAPAPNTQSVDDNFFNVAFTLRNNVQKSDKHRIVNSTFIEISPFKNFKFRSAFTYDILADYSFLSWDPRHGDGFGSQGIAQNIQQNFSRRVFQNYINYNFNVKDHNFYLTAGHELQQDETKWFSAQGNQVADLFFLQRNLISNAAAVQQVGGNFSERGLESLFGRLNYDFKGKYFAQFSIRRDGLSSLAPENRYGVFPGGSVGWRISEEDFWKNSGGLSKVVNDLKLKASYAQVGNDIGGFPWLSTFANRPYGNISGLGPAAVGNRELVWERSNKWGAGLEAGLFNNRFLFGFDWFLNDITDLIFAVPTPPSAGIPGNVINQNIGTMQNRGLEFSLSGDIIRKRDFTWGFNANFTSVKNEVTSLYPVAGEPLKQINNGGYNIIRVGDPLNLINGLRWAGVNTQTGNPMYFNAAGTLVQHNTSGVAGASLNAFYTARSMDDATMTQQTSLAFSDRDVLGQAIPTWFGGFGNNFRYKNFDAEFFFRFSGGNSVMNITRQEALLNQSFQNNGTEILQRWTTPGQVTNVPRLRWGNGNAINQNQLAVSRFVESGDFLRLQNIVIGYNFNSAKLATKTNGFITGLRIFVQGQNLWMSTKYSGTDPENASELGLDAAVSPQVGIVSGGLRMSF
jgi:TonB-dependent starch-binding outer membrane protein SusC